MKIYHVVSKEVDRFVLDPLKGTILRRENILSQSDLESIVRDGETYEVDAQGTFDVPETIGRDLLNRAVANGRWYEGENPFYAPYPIDHDDTANPYKAVRPVARKRTPKPE